MTERQPPTAGADRTPVLPHWYSPEAEQLTIVDAEGATVYDDAGEAYLDFRSQLYCANLGYDADAVVEAMAEQARRVPYVSSAHHNDARRRLAERLVDLAPGLGDVFFAVSGSEANEAAIQFAREYGDAGTVLTRWRSYHGATYGAGGFTGDPTTRKAIERHAATTGTTKFLPPLAYGGPFDADSPGELAEQAAAHLEWVIRNEGPDSVAAVLTEPIGGTSGAYPAPPGYFERVRELCDEYDVLLVSDEVITGFGRCGEWFGIQTYGVEPDAITFAKGVTGAYVPLAGVLVRPEVGAALREGGIPVGQTFAGHPVACAAGLAALDAYEDGPIENVRELAPVLEEGLGGVAADHEAVGDVRGRGFLWAVEFTDPETGEPFVHPWVQEGDNPVAEVRREAAERGVLFGAGRPDTQLVVAPPLTVDEDDVAAAVEALDSAVAAVF